MSKIRKMTRLKFMMSEMTYLLLLCTISLFICPCISADKSYEGFEIQVEHKPPECTEKSAVGDKVEIHYTGTLENGQIFDSSIKRQKGPIGLTLGAGQVIEGWEKGLLDMCIGEKRRLIIPPSMGYGDSGYPPVIPGGAKLLFEVNLVSLEKATQPSFDVLNMLKTLALPAILGYVLYFMYSRYKQEMEAKKEEKKKSKKRR